MSKEMFNAEQKERYIAFCLLKADTDNEAAYEKYLVNFFKRLGEHEREYNKDFANLDFTSMKTLMTRLASGTINYQRSVLTQLTQYVSWAIDNKKSTLVVNPLFGTNVNELNLDVSYADNMVSSFEDLEECLNKILAPIEQDYLDNYFRAFCMLLFEGLSTEEILHLKVKQINKADKTIMLGSKEVPIRTQTLSVVNYIIQQSEISSPVRSGQVKRYTITKTGYLLENSRPASEKKAENYREKYSSTFRVSFSQKVSGKTNKLNPTRIRLSGIFSRMYHEEQNGREIKYKEYFDYKKTNIRTANNLYAVKKEAAKEYQIWKNSFFQ